MDHVTPVLGYPSATSALVFGKPVWNSHHLHSDFLTTSLVDMLPGLCPATPSPDHPRDDINNVQTIDIGKGKSKLKIKVILRVSIAIAWIYGWVMGCTALSGCIHICDWSNYFHYNARNGSCNRPRNRHDWENRRYDWTITPFCITKNYRKLCLRLLENMFSCPSNVVFLWIKFYYLC